MPDPAETPEDLPPELPQFYRFGPWMLICGSFCVVLVLSLLAEALRWGRFADGLKVAGFMAMIYAIPLFVVLAFLQGILSAFFLSRRRRAPWRTWTVLSPALLMVAALLYGVASLYPPERRARRELAHQLGGPVPDSVRGVRLDFTGGIDPSWCFTFQVDPAGYDTIRGYRAYSSQGGKLQFDVPGTFYYLEYDPASRRCEFQSLDY